MKQEKKAKLLMGAVGTAMGIAGLSATSHSAMGQITFTTTQLSFAPGTAPSQASNIYNGGTQLTGWSVTSSTVNTPLIWTPGNPTPTALPLPSGSTFGRGMFTTGTYQVGVTTNASSGNLATLWNGPSSTPIILQPSGASSSNLFSVSADGSEQAGNYTPTGGSGHAALWKGTLASFVDLNPAGSTSSLVNGNIVGQQVGTFQPGANSLAALWSGTAASIVNLSPSGATFSSAAATVGSQQAGSVTFATGGQQGAVWYGSAASYVNLTTPGFASTIIRNTNGSQQVGYGTPTGGAAKAMLWNGTAGSYTNLGALLGSGFTTSYAQSIVGNTVYGTALGSSGGTYAVTWTLPTVSLTWNNSGIADSTGATSSTSTIGSGDGQTWDNTGVVGSNNNWNNGYTLAAFNAGFNATFNDANNGHYTVKLNTSVAPTSVVFNNSAGAYSISGTGSITGSGSLTKIGSSALSLNTANTFTGPTTLTQGTLNLTNGNALSGTSGVTIAAGTSFNYLPTSNSQLAIPGSLSLSAGSGTVLSTSIGSTPTGAEINVAGAATISDAPLTLNIFGINGVAATSGVYTLIHGGAGSSLNPATTPTVNYLNDTSFSASNFTRTATDLQVTLSAVTPLTAAYWNGGLSGASNVWAVSDGSTHSNWVSSASGGTTPVVPGSGADVYISASAPTVAPTSTVLGANMIIKTLTIGDTTNGLGLAADGNTLTITPASSSTGITVSSGVPASSIAANIALGANQTWTNNSAQPFTVSGTISGTSSLTTAGTGTVVLSGTNTFTGNTAVASGTLRLSGSLALQDSILTSNGVAFDPSVSSHSFTVGALGGSFNLALADSASNPINLNLGNNSASYSGVLSGAGGVTEVGTGTQVLSGASTYSGNTNLSAGTLNVGGAEGAGSGPLGTGSILFRGGTLQYSAANQFDYSPRFSSSNNQLYSVDPGGQTVTWATPLTSPNGSLTVQGTGTLVLTAAETYTGNTTISSGTLQLGDGTSAGDNASIASGIINNNGTLNFNVNGSQTNASVITGNGSLSKTGPGTLTLANFSTFIGATTVSAGTLQLGDGNFDDAAVGGAIIDNAAVTANTIDAETIASTISGSGTFSVVNYGRVILTGTDTYTGVTTISNGGTLQLGNASAGSITASNIVNNSILVYDGQLNITYSGVISGSGSVKKIYDGTIVSLQPILIFTGANTYTGVTTISRGTLQLGNGSSGNDGSIAGASIVDNANLAYNLFGNETYAGVISGTGNLGKTGAGKLELASANSYAGVTNVSAGTLQVDTTGALPINTTLNVSSGATVIAKDLGGGSSKQLLVLSATPILNGKLDLTTNDLVVHGGNLTTLNTFAKLGFNSGAWNGSSGILSSSAASNTSHLTAVGVIQNSANGSSGGTVLYPTFDSISGGSVSTDVLLKYTYYGDANLDGKVDGGDYSRIDASYLSEQSGPAVTGWFNGDFNYDGVVDGSDYTLMDNAFNSQGTQIAAQIGGQIASPTAEIAGTASVPEPTTLSLLGISAAGLLGRRRRR
jgi:autotransporter-associated beta strand protein